MQKDINRVALSPRASGLGAICMAGDVDLCTIHCDDDTFRAAFDWHLIRYGQRKRAWDTPYHVSMWQRAQLAFEHRSQADFDYVYEELRRRWQAFRGARDFWTPQETFNALIACCPELQKRRLAELTPLEIPSLWNTLLSVRDLKQNSSGPSIVAISKFLHFWNPRMFVIVDDGVIWKRVLAHHWLWEPIRRLRDETDISLFGTRQAHNDATCDMSTYLAILIFAAGFVQAHPNLPLYFAEYIRRHAGTVSLPSDIAEYDAVAMEWFLLGVVEIPPPGWTTTSHLGRAQK